MKDAQPAILVSITEDLFFGMKIEVAAKQEGLNLVWLSEARDVKDRWLEMMQASAGQRVTVMLDLATRIPWKELLPLAGTQINWIAYGAHVERDLLDEARRLGLNRVMPRSKFSKLLPDLLAAVNEKEAS